MEKQKIRVLILSLCLSVGCGVTLKKTPAPVQKNLEVDTQTKEIETIPEEQQQPPSKPLKVGVILGPGGSRGFAHTGVLRELLKAQIPIHLIVGLEWGALIGGMFASKGQIHETEWELYKLQRKDFLGKKSLFRSKQSPIGISHLKTFMDDTIGEIKFHEMKIDFACPALSIWSGIIQWQNKGSLQKALHRCWPYPPLFKPKGAWVAAAFALPESVVYLENRGMDVIVFVNVMDRGELLTTSQQTSDYKSSILWQALRHSLQNEKCFKQPHVEVINIPTKNFKIYSFDNRRRLVTLGEQAGRRAAEKLWHKYAF